MHLRFRHRFPLMGHFLHWTVSRHGVSLNAHVGLFSRSWGTQAKTTTVDMPGHLGFFWRKQSRRRPRSHISDEDRQLLAAAHAGNRWTHVAVALAVLEALVEAIHIWVHPFSNVVISGQPLFILVVLSGALIALIIFAHKRDIVGGLVIFVLALLGIYLQWILFHAWAWGDVHAALTHALPALAPTHAT
jgi:hypothetical protein